MGTFCFWLQSNHSRDWGYHYIRFVVFLKTFTIVSRPKPEPQLCLTSSPTQARAQTSEQYQKSVYNMKKYDLYQKTNALTIMLSPRWSWWCHCHGNPNMTMVQWSHSVLKTAKSKTKSIGCRPALNIFVVLFSWCSPHHYHSYDQKSKRNVSTTEQYTTVPAKN